METDAVNEDLGVGGDHLGEDYKAGGPQVEFNAFKTIAAQSHYAKFSSYRDPAPKIFLSPKSHILDSNGVWYSLFWSEGPKNHLN